MRLIIKTINKVEIKCCTDSKTAIQTEIEHTVELETNKCAYSHHKDFITYNQNDLKRKLATLKKKKV